MTSDAPRQLALDLPHRPAMDRDDFIVAPSNATALAAIDGWPNWPHHALVLIGDPGSGKSHLAAVWMQMSGAQVRLAKTLTASEIDALKVGANLVIEHCERGFGDEAAAFHALNMAREHAGAILFTATSNVAGWPVALPDLASRLRAIPQVALEAPDDLLLRAVLGKLFADRQIAVSARIVEHIATRMQRSLDTARRIVDAIDRLSLAERRNITRALANRVLDELAIE